MHETLLDASAAFGDHENRYLATLAAAAPPEPVGVDEFFGIFFGAIEAADLASPFDAFETACADLEIAACGLGATEGICLSETSS